MNSFDVRHDVAYSATYISQHNNESVRIHSKLEILTEWHGLTWNMNRLSTPLPVLRCSHFIFHREKRGRMVCVLERRQHGRWGCQNFNHFQIILSMCFRASRAFQKRREENHSGRFSAQLKFLTLFWILHVMWNERNKRRKIVEKVHGQRRSFKMLKVEERVVHEKLFSQLNYTSRAGITTNKFSEFNQRQTSPTGLNLFKFERWPCSQTQQICFVR